MCKGSSTPSQPVRDRDKELERLVTQLREHPERTLSEDDEKVLHRALRAVADEVVPPCEPTDPCEEQDLRKRFVQNEVVTGFDPAALQEDSSLLQSIKWSIERRWHTCLVLLFRADRIGEVLLLRQVEEWATKISSQNQRNAAPDDAAQWSHDVAQEVVYVRLHKCDVGRPFKPWARKVLRNSWIDYNRKQRPKGGLIDEAAGGGPESGAGRQAVDDFEQYFRRVREALDEGARQTFNRVDHFASFLLSHRWRQIRLIARSNELTPVESAALIEELVPWDQANQDRRIRRMWPPMHACWDHLRPEVIEKGGNLTATDLLAPLRDLLHTEGVSLTLTQLEATLYQDNGRSQDFMKYCLGDDLFEELFGHLFQGDAGERHD